MCIYKHGRQIQWFQSYIESLECKCKKMGGVGTYLEFMNYNNARVERLVDGGNVTQLHHTQSYEDEEYL